MRKVFVSYRKHDLTVGFAGWIHRYLEERLGPGSVFRDLDSLPPGVEFLPRIRAALRECDVALVLVGPHWNPPGKDGRLRLDDPNDVLRMEIAEALGRKHVQVLPVLFAITALPEDLPPDISKLRELQFAYWYLTEPERAELKKLWRKIAQMERDAVVRPDPTTETMAVIAPGSVVDGYKLGQELSRSDAATVYRGKQLALDRPVAIKVMSERAAQDPAARQRFVLGGKLMAKIGHEHIIPVYDIGEAARRPYLVMHLVEGNTLAETLAAAGPLGVAQALHVAEGLASALDVAHAAGLEHGAVTPANILVERATARTFLSDFGPADPTDEHRPHAVVAADIEGLAHVLASLLVGQAGEISGPAPAVPAQLRELVMHALEPGGLNRFGSAAALAAAAHEAYEQAPTTSEVPTIPTGLSGLPLSASLCVQVLELTEDALPGIADSSARFIAENVRRRLREPIHLAVAGQARAGASTLVNALLGRRLAPTEGAPPNYIGWYRYGSSERVDVILRGGERVPAEIDRDGIRIAGSGCSPEEVSGIDARLPLESLRGLTLIDLPGREFDRGESDPGAPRSSDEDYVTAVQRADALLLVVKGDAKLHGSRRVGELAARFGPLAGGTGLTALNAVALVSTAGVLSGNGDPLERAGSLAGDLAIALGRRVAATVPIMPLLAEVVTGNAINDGVLFAVGALAELDPAVRGAVLDALEAGRSLPRHTPLTRDELDLLYRTLGAYGIHRGLELAHAGQLTRSSLVQRLRELSGLDQVLKQLGGLQLRADALKAGQALQALDKLSWKPGLAFLGDRVEELRFSGAGMELLALVGAFSGCVSGELELREDKIVELQRLLTGRSTAERLGLGADAEAAELRAEARRRLRAWKAFEGSAASSQAEKYVAAAVARRYQALSEEEIKRGVGEWASVQ